MAEVIVLHSHLCSDGRISDQNLAVRSQTLLISRKFIPLCRLCGRSAQRSGVFLFFFDVEQEFNGVARPFIGGTFANPATRFPDSLGKIQILREFPYLLPCAIAAALAFAGFVFGFLGLKEVCKLVVGFAKRRVTCLCRPSRRPLPARPSVGEAPSRSLFWPTRPTLLPLRSQSRRCALFSSVPFSSRC